MKTVFKVGQEVFDQVYYPGIKGKVVEIDNDGDFPIRVEFGVFEGSYKLDGRANNFQVPTLSTKHYEMELQGFEQKAPAPTFKEALDWLKNNKDYRTTYRDNRIYPSNEIYVAFEALRKLIILRDYYNEGWKPKNNSYVHIITTRNGELVKDCLMGDFRVLYFESKEISNTFFEEQRELLETAKPLL